MIVPVNLRTDRLLLRQWLPTDRPLLAEINADPRVMEFFPCPLSRCESDQMVERIEAHFDKHGFGLWAAEIPGIAPLIGFVGLNVPRFEAPFTPCIEIGWRLAAIHWNRGYATEGARAVLNFAFGPLEVDEIVAFTVPHNVRSRRVMEKLGMKYSASEDFYHPLVAEGHPLRKHVLYRLKRDDHNHNVASLPDRCPADSLPPN